MIIVDTSGLLAALDASEARHVAAARALLDAEPPRLLSPFVLAELDYLVGTRVSRTVAQALLADVARGAYQLEPFSSDDLEEVLAVLNRYPDLDIGLADASLVVLSERHNTLRILTLDERHFRALRGPRGRAFELLPAGAAA